MFRNVLLCLMSASFLAAQVTTSQIVGTVFDPQGTVVPGAQITARNEQTGLIRTARANPVGNYTLSALPVGFYSVTFGAPGFKQLVRKGIEMTANQVARLDGTLEVGALTEQITVSANVTAVDTSTATLDSLIDSRRVVDLPLNGRNVLDLVALSAGVTHDATANGASLSQQLINVNGNRAYSTNILLDGASMYYGHRGAGLTQPPPDAVQEVKVITSGVTAEFGHGSSSISVVTKNGTNELHGSLWNYFRNDALDARSFFAAAVPKLRYNQFGGTAGGPIKRNKAFFFGSFQGMESRADVVQSSAFPPTALERQGNFAGSSGKAPVDPLTKLPFPNATIPQTRFDPVAMKLLSRFPLPDRANGQYVAQISAPSHTRTFLGRVDYDFTQNDRTTVRYFLDGPYNASPFASGNIDGYTAASTANRTQTATLAHTHTFGGNLLLNARVSYTRFLYSDANTVRTTLADLGANFVTGGGPGSLPNATITGRVTAVADKDGQRVGNTGEAGADMSWFHGNHEVKFGGQVQRNRFLLTISGRAYGEFTFDGTFTGNPLADFMLGQSSLLWQETARVNDIHMYTPGFYGQDRWRATRRLTFTLGLRYEIYTPWRAFDGQEASVQPGAKSTLFPTAPPGMIYQSEPGFPYQTMWKNFAPRVGFAWDVFGTGKTSVRAGYGISYDQLDGGMFAQNVQPYAPDLKTTNVGPLSDPQRYVTVPFGKPISRQNPTFSLPIVLASSEVGQLVAPYSQNLNFTVEHEILPNTMVQASYVGSLGRHVPMAYQQNPAVYGPGATTANTDARRVLAPYFGALTGYATQGFSAYNGLQVQVGKRFSQGFTLNETFAFSKAMDDVSTGDVSDQWYPQDPANRRGSRGLGDFNMRRRLITSWVWDLPFRRDQKQFIGKLFGAWQLSGILTLQDGNPFLVVTGTDRSLTGVGYDRPDLLGNPALPQDRPLATRLAQYFNTAMFQANAPGRYGSAGRNILDGPGRAVLDASLHEKFPLWSERRRLEMRWDVFNATNRANFSAPGATLSSATSFGKVTSAAAGRVMQFALRMEF